MTAYWNPPTLNGVLMKLSVGQYLAKDKGATIDVAKRFDSGVAVGGWAAIRNVSKDDYGEGGFSKGFRNCVAVDLGASSGRVMLARYERECRSLTLREIHRFKNGLHSQNGYVTWDVDSLESAIRLGLNMVCEEGIRIDSIGIDTWGVDFVLLDQQGQRVGLPVAYRDSRTNGLMAQAQQQLGKRDIYQRSGIQFLPFNTLYHSH